MTRSRNDRHAVLRSSRSYYANRAYYRDLFDQRRRRDPGTDRELDFLEHAFRTHAQRRIERVLDVACGGGRHVVGLARRGYECVGQDFTRERVEMAKARAHRAQVSVRLKRADATRLRFVSEFDAVLALNILFLLPDDDDVQRCLRQIHRALRPGGLIVCNIENPFGTRKGWLSTLLRRGHRTETSRVPGLRITNVQRLGDVDPVLGVAWIEETSKIETSDGRRTFRDRERVRLFTYWDLTNYLRAAGFGGIQCYPDWERKPPKKPLADELVFVARKRIRKR